MKTAIIIPARYGSSRFPGKPLAKVLGKELLLHVHDCALKAAKEIGDTQIAVATEDSRIKDFCDQHGLNCVMTAEDCPSGTDRAKQAAEQLNEKPDFVVNLQGDLIIPSRFVKAMIADFLNDPETDIITPVTQLSWDALDDIRKAKQTLPFSGTTVTMDKGRYAFWFSKNIIPAIRKEDKLRAEDKMTSPIFRHLGMYGYKMPALERFVTLPEGTYEKLEGLEQLRALENGMKIRCVAVDYGNDPILPGIDSPEDLTRAEALINKS